MASLGMEEGDAPGWFVLSLAAFCCVSIIGTITIIVILVVCAKDCEKSPECGFSGF